MENKIESLELEEMRQQMLELRKQLDEQVKVNEEFITEKMHTNISSFKTKDKWMLILSILGIYPLWVYCKMYDVSIFFLWAYIIYVIAEVLFFFHVMNIIKEDDFQNSNVSGMLTKLIRIKKLNRISSVIEIVIVSLMVVWVFYDTVFGAPFGYFSHFDQTKVVIGFIVCAVFGYYWSFCEMKKRNKKIREMIDMLS